MTLNRRPPKKRRTPKPTVRFQGPDGKAVDSKLKFYVEKGKLPGQWEMYVCRGEKCPRGPVSQKLGKHRCGDCILADPKESVGQLTRRIEVLNSSK